ncbi:hypothetical protein GJW-30_1_03243 [Variibacter gotjawalensis]|uniref:CNP1-like family protein n=1 Tax=Variibacter gotjawalensis TaxID=1333996 RepID=A0A0S3PXP1_9BRAD|nr:hypothetical protein [Variibacter gotjawalensis]NIK46528.1 hypothetical protein [Variibacter gotjawalensis]RZS48433.1 hypothetical protein EV661_0846 [Variibacter gotjawalensis]BAT60694.1 hypothetical protein GJW-30_1_03243 [Variibacter gotjawalensis]
MRKRALAVLILAASCATALAAAWTTYGNARFKYFVDIPPGFSKLEEAENGDGGSASSPDGKAEFLVWGTHLANTRFSDEIASRVGLDSRDGWNVSYRKDQPIWAVWSGSKDGRIFYTRAIVGCDDAAAFFRLEYDKAVAKAYDPIVARLSKSLRSGKC